MLLRGCSSAAKKVAMALHTLIHTKYPRDRLFVVGFAYYARQLKPESIPTLSPYEFEYGTNLQHALIIARQLLGRSNGGNKEIVVITDGEPTAHIDNGQVEFAYPPTLRTVQSTLREVGRCTREGIVINTFMLERSRYLSEFVDLMCGSTADGPSTSSRSTSASTSSSTTSARRRSASPSDSAALGSADHGRCSVTGYITTE